MKTGIIAALFVQQNKQDSADLFKWPKAYRLYHRNTFTEVCILNRDVLIFHRKQQGHIRCFQNLIKLSNLCTDYGQLVQIGIDPTQFSTAPLINYKKQH